MKILVLNCGSSSLKYQLFAMEQEQVLAKGLVEKIGLADAIITHKTGDGQKIVNQTAIPDHAKAIELVLAALTDKNHGVISSMKEIDAVGHRTVHGGTTYAKSVLIDDKVVAELKRLIKLAPLHNPPGILGIEACEKIMPGVPMVAVFDTSFHQTMPAKSYIYGIPYEYYEKYGVRRYGFHGTSHRFVAQRMAELLGKPFDDCKIITCHLGNGSSIAAIENGKVVDTSMGFTPLEGLMMGTRCGNIDPAIIPFLMEEETMDISAINAMMNKKSGLLGISGISSDMRDIEQAAAQGNERAQLALDIFHHNVIKTVGGYIALMNGVDGIAFTAGIGENGPATRKLVCEQFAYAGLQFDAAANQCRGKEVEISKPGSKIRAFVVPTDEELMIARDTKALASK